jgi:hypothetical protein
MENPELCPKTMSLSDAVEFLLLNLEYDYLLKFALLKESDLVRVHFIIRNEICALFRLNDPESALRRKGRHIDDVTMMIVKQMWLVLVAA